MQALIVTKCADAMKLLWIVGSMILPDDCFNTVRLRSRSTRTPMQEQMPLSWCPLLYCFASKSLSVTPDILKPPFVPFTKSPHRSQSVHITFALLSVRDLALHAFFTRSSHLLQDLPLTLLPFSPHSYSLLVNYSSLLRSNIPKHFKTFRSTRSLISSLTSTLRVTSLFLNIPSLVNPQIFKQFISASGYMSVTIANPLESSDLACKLSVW